MARPLGADISAFQADDPGDIKIINIRNFESRLAHFIKNEKRKHSISVEFFYYTQ